MKHFSYQKNNFFIENISVKNIAKQVKTPFYAYSKKSLIENYENFKKNFSDIDCKICYAIKANSNLNLVKILSSLGSGIDAVSQGEIYKAISANIDPKKIVFAGVGKTESEIEYALSVGVEEFSAESEPEIYSLNNIAKKLGKKIKLSVRVNPNVDANTHDKISTGRKGDKFGIDIEIAKEIYKKASELSNIEVYGIATHIGSQITSIEPFKKSFLKIRELCIELKNDKHNIQSLDLGGGIGISYNNEPTIDIAEYAKMIKEIIKDLNVKLTIAPGRAIAGSAGIMVSEVIYVKDTSLKKFAIIDAAMNDLARPGLYGSYHEVLQEEIKRGSKQIYEIAGPVCESTDILAKSRELIEVKQQDLLIFLNAGAYGSSMSSEYNCRPLIPEILIDDSIFKIIRRRPSMQEMISFEIV